MIKIPEHYWPAGMTHPGTGEVLVACLEFECNTEVQTIHTSPPSAPSRELWDLDDYGNATFIRNLTDEEFVTATQSYEREKKRWTGSENIPGPVIVTGTFATATGAKCKGQWGGKQWVWLWRTGSPRPEPTHEMVPAVCACGHKGKSRWPEHYRCGRCYYTARAKGHDARAARHEEQAAKLRKEAQADRDRALSFVGVRSGKKKKK